MEDTNTAVFNEICELVTNPDFREGQLNFFNANCAKFFDTDENKLEYTTLHNEYV